MRERTLLLAVWLSGLSTCIDFAAALLLIYNEINLINMANVPTTTKMTNEQTSIHTHTHIHAA